jgi:hypothetical protein
MPNIHISTPGKSVPTSHVVQLYKMTQNSFNLKHFGRNFEANTELSKSVCNTVSQPCGLCTEHGRSPFEQSFLKSESNKVIYNLL